MPSQHEAREGNCLLLNFQIDNDIASYSASSNKTMILIQPIVPQTSFRSPKIYTTKTLQQRCRIQQYNIT